MSAVFLSPSILMLFHCYCYSPARKSPLPWRVLRFEGTEALSDQSHFQFWILSEEPLDPTHWTNQVLSLVWDEAKSISRMGIISEIRIFPKTLSGFHYQVTLSSFLTPLMQSIERPRVFIDLSVPEIITLILAESDWSKKIPNEARFYLKNAYAPLPCWIRFEESEFDNLQRLCSLHGIHFFFEPIKDQMILVFSDRNQIEQMGHYYSNATFYANTKTNRNIHISANKTKAEKLGSLYDLLPQAQMLSAISKMRSQSQKLQIFEARTDYKHLHPGQILSVQGHPNPKLNQDYLILSVQHQGEQAKTLLGERIDGKETEKSADHYDQNRLNYQNKLTLLPDKIPFQKLLTQSQRFQAPLQARLEAGTGIRPNAAVDEMGTYRFRYPFEEPEEAKHPGKNSKGFASPKTRFLQIMSSAGRGQFGMHFPNPEGTLVEIGFLHGDINQPFILGAIHEEHNIVHENNHQQHRFLTSGKHHWCFDDHPNQSNISLSAQQENQGICLGMNRNFVGAQMNGIRCWANRGEMTLFAQTALCFETEASFHLTAKNYHIDIQERFNLQVQQHLRWNINQNQHFNAQGFRFHTEDQHLFKTQTSAQFSANTLLIQASEQWQFISHHSLIFQAKGIRAHTQSQLLIRHAGAEISLDNGEIRIQSPVGIELLAKRFQSQGNLVFSDYEDS